MYLRPSKSHASDQLHSRPNGIRKINIEENKGRVEAAISQLWPRRFLRLCLF